ncbi:hypothetical protein ACGFMM_25620 [Streptomyces sp. NPDC048604]|uniref:hypothetical protein n=1 Tax=Streptomyces sp. NPDC048604 TaxID=3365578 RepID=UPI00371839B8
MADAAAAPCRYPHLGWDPVPGSPAELAALKARLTASAASLGTAHRLVDRLLSESSYWSGEAADAFRAALDGELPRYLKNAHRSLTKAAGRLGAWHDDLVGLQATARRHDTRAGLQSAAVRTAEARWTAAARNAQTPEADLKAAVAAVNRARTALAATRAHARELEETHRTTAARIARELDAATDRLAPKEPGALDKALGWLDENLGDVLSATSATLGLVALFAGPLAVPLLFVAAGASVAALLLHSRDPKIRAGLAAGPGDARFWTSTATLTGDAVGTLPGVGAVAKGAAGAAAAAREGGAAVGLGGHASRFASESGTAMGTFAEGGTPVAAWVAARTGRPGAAPAIDVGTATAGVAASGTGLVADEDDTTARGAASAVEGAKAVPELGNHLKTGAELFGRAP